MPWPAFVSVIPMKQLLFSLFALLSLSVSAQNDSLPQQIRFGYLSYDSALISMPQYIIAQAKLKELRQAYDKEVKRVEDEFNQKYESFLEGQRDFPRTILLKRQNELQELMQKNLEFKQQGRRDLEQAEAEAIAPLRTQLNEAIASVAHKNRLSLVVNTDSNACPFIEPSQSLNIQEEVINLLKK